MRGEQFSASAAFLFAVGSPPLARGTDYQSTPDVLRARITPACAGNSFMLRFNMLTTQDHPRLRGEQKSIEAE